jgi:excinuclease ABC subunit B
VERQERVLITTLTKRMAEDLTDYLDEHGVRVRYLHSEIHSIERIEIIQDLRKGSSMCWWGSTCCGKAWICRRCPWWPSSMPTRKGFLRAERSLIQTIGRAARHVRGQAILYADNLTDSMAKAIDETERRRGIQQAYNERTRHHPQPIVRRKSNAILSFLEVSRKLNVQELEEVYEQKDDLPLEDIPELIGQLEKQMKEASKNLEFEEAAKYRDRIKVLRDKLLGKKV